MRWLGFDWGDREFYASDYFEQLYECAEQLIARRQGLRRRPDGRRDPRAPRHAHRAGPREPVPRPAASRRTSTCSAACGRASSRTAPRSLRAKIDMASPNINMRDPVMYRIRRATHHRTGDAWCIYPMYDYAHPLSRTRSRGSRTRSARWSSRTTGRSTTGSSSSCRCPPRPQQIEFARLNLTYTVMSKRKLLQLVQEGHVRGWDDPRMPTHRRPAPPRLHARGDPRLLPTASASPRTRTSSTSRCSSTACARTSTGARRASWRCSRPLKVVIENYPEGQVEELEAVNNPEDPAAGTRAGAVLARALHRARRLPRGPAEEVLPPVARRARCGCATPTSITCTGVVKDARRRGRRAALHLRPGHARRRRARRPQGEGHDPLGVGGARASTPRCGSTTACSPTPDPERRAGGTATSPRTSTRTRSRWSRRRRSSRAWRTRRPARASSSSALGYFCVDPDSDARPAGLQPHRRPARHVGEDREERRVAHGPEKPARSRSQSARRPMPPREPEVNLRAMRRRSGPDSFPPRGAPAESSAAHLRRGGHRASGLELATSSLNAP